MIAASLASLLAILGTLVTFILWYYKRKAEKDETPVEQNKARYEQIAEDVASGDAGVNTDHLTSDLDQLDRLRREREKGSRSSK